MPKCPRCSQLEQALGEAAAGYLQARDELQALTDDDGQRPIAGLRARQARTTLIEAIHSFNEHRKAPHVV